MCNQLLLQFSMNVSQTLQMYCGRIEEVHMGSDGAKNKNLQNYGILKILVALCTVVYVVCVINFSYSLNGCFLSFADFLRTY